MIAHPARLLNLPDALDMPPALERRVEEDPHEFQGDVLGDHPLANGDDVGVVVPAAELRRLRIPDVAASHALDLVRNDGLTVARPAEDDPALAFPAGHGLRDGPA